jgi:hypothetical protein
MGQICKKMMRYTLDKIKLFDYNYQINEYLLQKWLDLRSI